MLQRIKLLISRNKNQTAFLATQLLWFPLFPSVAGRVHGPFFDLVPQLLLPLEIVVTFWFFGTVFFHAKRNAYEPERLGFLSVIGVCVVANLVIYFAMSYSELGVIDRGTRTTDPLTCLYFSAITWSTVGYGDVIPTPSARFLAACESVLAYLVMTTLISLLVITYNALATYNSSKEESAT